MEYANDSFREIFNNSENIHYSSGPSYTKIQKAMALLNLQDNELEGIFNLVECLAPSLRFTATSRYEKASKSVDVNALPLDKDNLNFECNTSSLSSNIQKMLDKVAEMPKEWVLIQLTSQHNIKENFEVNVNKLHMSPLHIIVFNCGQSKIKPFCMTVNVPKDKISGNTIELRQEMQSIAKENSKFYDLYSGIQKFKGQSEKQSYSSHLQSINYRLEDLVKQIQNTWLGEWRSLFIGKFINKKIEEEIETEVDVLLKLHNCSDITQKAKQLLIQAIKGSSTIRSIEVRKVLKYVFSDDILFNEFSKLINRMYQKYNFESEARHPVILIIDEKLDALPWEMMDVLEDHPVTRMPSFHFTYALYKEHEASIVDGLKINVIPTRGKYVINPGSDLKKMEVRLTSFLNYWCPKWTGIAGSPPSESDFRDMLKESDIFVYSGHGSGTQFVSGDKIQRMKVNAIVLLFGCASVCLSSLGPQVEMYSSYHMYLIACSPCIVGMLWIVSDISTDALTTDFLSAWLPSNAQTDWKFVDIQKWRDSGTLNFNSKKLNKSSSFVNEPELLRALHRAKKNAQLYWIRAACVVRGLPVKLQQIETSN